MNMNILDKFVVSILHIQLALRKVEVHDNLHFVLRDWVASPVSDVSICDRTKHP